MSENQRLLAHILDHPEDISGRLVYADWCDENGRPERAAEIRDPKPHEDETLTVRHGFIEEMTLTRILWETYSRAVFPWHPVRKVTVREEGRPDVVLTFCPDPRGRAHGPDAIDKLWLVRAECVAVAWRVPWTAMRFDNNWHGGREDMVRLSLRAHDAVRHEAERWVEAERRVAERGLPPYGPNPTRRILDAWWRPSPHGTI